MPSDKIKSPDLFPEYFPRPLLLGLGKWWMMEADDKQPCRAVARKYRAFLNSIKQFPLHPLNAALELKTARTKVEQHRDGQWILYIVVNKKIDWGGILAEIDN